ncbi:MAG TPA: hypothetical protein VIW94_07265 [Acidimicrobiia bacterium]
MTRFRIPVLLALMAMTAACTSGLADPPTTDAGADATNGRIVVLNDDGNIRTMDPDGSSPIEITTDGSSVQHFQPVWSPLSRVVAWGQGGDQGFAVGLRNEERTESVMVPVGGFPFYLNWSPDEMRIGVLHNGVNGSVDFELIDVADASAGVVDSGSPYYFSWSPDGSALVVHVGGDRLEIFDESASSESVTEVTPNFLAPQWTPKGIFYFGTEGLTLRRGPDDEEVLIDAEGFVSINPNPDASLVAMHVLNGEVPGLTVSFTSQELAETNAISIVDVESGVVDVISGQIPVGSFWSPDGKELLILSLNGNPGLIDLMLWNDGDLEMVDTIEIPPSMVTQALQYLDQYTQSLQVWSPDSTSFVLPATRDGVSGIWVFDRAGAEPVRISDGSWASWSSN